MDEKLRKIQIAYFALYTMIALLIVLGETDIWSLDGVWTDKQVWAYYYQTIVILLTVACVPAALKYFAVWLSHQIDQMPLAEALKAYVRLSLLRIALLALPAIAGVVGCYLLLNTSCLLCTCISLIATFFCWPSMERMKRDLHIEADNDMP